MKFITFSSLFSIIESKSNLDELRAKASQFWIDQFKPFEETGFTKDMILGAQDLYFSLEF